jgi:hypothetical protein
MFNGYADLVWFPVATKLDRRYTLATQFALPRGVIGNTRDFGSFILGSSPSGVALGGIVFLDAVLFDGRFV